MKFISKRLDYFDSSTIRAAFEAAATIPNHIDLSIGFPGEDTPPHIKEAGIEAIKDNQTRYTPTNGTQELRQAIAGKLKKENRIKATTSTVTVVPGSTTGILLIYLATLDPDDEVLLPQPYFPPYKDLALMVGAKPVLIDTAPTFQLTAEMIESRLTPKSKLLVINSPNNPTGAVYPKAELIKIAELARKHHLLVVSDEAYEYFAYDNVHFSIGSLYPNTLTMNSFSKSYAMTGWRIGYISGPEPIIEAINQLQQYIVFSSSSIGQHASLAALSRPHDSLNPKYKAKRDLALSVLRDTFSDIQGGQGAFYLFLKLPGGISDVGFVNHLAHRGVIVLPGRAFGTYRNYIRVSYAGEDKNLQQGLERVCETIKIMTDKKYLVPKR
ncbi:MAG TPA: aminotransferase class I/II-fold pyridoxal phosphate-dependent enzyme [Candidatus Saccharimonadales bacterium]|nr:aminotransferase class I/II-fold pyridoxal phosphate-dependent enzyme [Candidatus Saccharimonadales bacterium]